MFRYIKIYVLKERRKENKLKQISKVILSCCEDHFCVDIIFTITIELYVFCNINLTRKHYNIIFIKILNLFKYV